MTKTSPKTKKLVTKIVCGVVALILIAAMIVANYYLNYFSVIIHAFFVGDMVDTSQGADAFENADTVVQNVAAESMVLLENKEENGNKYLPKKDLAKVNLFGWGSTEYGFLLTGGGSGGRNITLSDEVPLAVKVNLHEAFEQEDIDYNKDLYNAYCAFSTYDADFRSGGSTGKNAVDSLQNPGADFYTAERMSQAYSYSHVAVAVISRWGCENGGESELKSIGKYQDGTILELTAEEKAMFDALQAKGFEVIVVMNTTNFVEMSFVKDYSCIKATIYAGIPGQSGATAIPKIIKGTVNPSGRLNDTLAYDFQTDNPTYVNAHYTFGNVVYQEGIYFGYKWYETADAEHFFDGVDNKYGKGYDGVVQYPFGYGLSYTKFDKEVTFPSDAAITKDGKYTVSVKVTNNGSEPGREVVQLYGHSEYKENGIEKPERILLDFAKTDVIEPGKDETVTLTFTAYDLSSYDAYDKNGNGFKGYELEGGENMVEISVRENAHTAIDSKKYNVNAGVAGKPDASITYPVDPKTGKAVVNRFTGDTAYADVPIDGTTAYNDMEYLSRANDFGNYNKLKQYKQSNAAAVNKATSYVYDGYNTPEISAEVAKYEYGSDAGLYITGYDNGGKYLKQPTVEMLNGKDTSVEIVFNEELLEELIDYDNTDYWTYFLDQLTQAEIDSVIGQGGFRTLALESVGKPFCTDKDGPAGFNNNVTAADKATEYTLFPAETLTGCSFSKKGAYDIGDAQGKIGYDVGIQGWYGPGVNLHRSLYNSRNYEYYSEDAVLSGKLAAETITGARDNHVYCYLKHMAVSEAGQNPKEWNTWLTEQAFRESYLKPFEIAVKEGKTTGIMSAFNRVGAVLSAYNHAMLTDVLRNEWGFRGSVITDWYEGNGYASDHVKGVLGGNDLWLCGTTQQNAGINFDNPAQAYAARISAKNILYTFIDTNYGAEGMLINKAPYSELFITLWTLVNVVLGVGIGVCVVFFVLSFFNLKRKPKTANAGAGDGSTATEQETVPCPTCGEPNPSGCKFCKACGNEMPTEQAKEEVKEEAKPEETAAEPTAETETAAEPTEPTEDKSEDKSEPTEQTAEPTTEETPEAEAEAAAVEAKPEEKPVETEAKPAAKKSTTKSSGTKSTSTGAKKSTGTKSASSKSTSTGAKKSSGTKSSSTKKKPDSAPTENT